MGWMKIHGYRSKFWVSVDSQEWYCAVCLQYSSIHFEMFAGSPMLTNLWEAESLIRTPPRRQRPWPSSIFHCESQHELPGSPTNAARPRWASNTDWTSWKFWVSSAVPSIDGRKETKFSSLNHRRSVNRNIRGNPISIHLNFIFFVLRTLPQHHRDHVEESQTSLYFRRGSAALSFFGFRSLDGRILFIEVFAALLQICFLGYFHELFPAASALWVHFRMGYPTSKQSLNDYMTVLVAAHLAPTVPHPTFRKAPKITSWCQAAA